MVDDDRDSAGLYVSDRKSIREDTYPVIQVLDEEHLKEHEEEPETDEDTKLWVSLCNTTLTHVSPDVAIGVSVTRVHVVISRHGILANTRAHKRAKLVWSDIVTRY